MINPVPGIYLEKCAGMEGAAKLIGKYWDDITRFGGKYYDDAVRLWGRRGAQTAGEVVEQAGKKGGRMFTFGGQAAAETTPQVGRVGRWLGKHPTIGGAISKVTDFADRHPYATMFGLPYAIELGGKAVNWALGGSDVGYAMPAGIGLGDIGAPLAAHAQYTAGMPDSFQQSMMMNQMGPRNVQMSPVGYAMPGAQGLPGAQT